jgi:hypothetical protein
MQAGILSRGCASRGSVDAQSENGSSRYSLDTASRCSNRMGANAASLGVPRALNAAVSVVTMLMRRSDWDSRNCAAAARTHCNALAFDLIEHNG